MGSCQEVLARSDRFRYRTYMIDTKLAPSLARPLVEVGLTHLREALLLFVRIVTDATSRFMLTEGIVRPLEVSDTLPASISLEVGNLLVAGPVDLSTLDGEAIDDITSYAPGERRAFLQIEDEDDVIRSIEIPIFTSAWHDLISRVRSTRQLLDAFANAEETEYTGKITTTSRPACAPFWDEIP